MAVAGMVLSVLAGLGMLIFGIQILIMAFKTSIGWGLASFFIPLAVFVFVFKFWDQTKKPFLLWLACLPVAGLGFALTMMGAASSATQ